MPDLSRINPLAGLGPAVLADAAPCGWRFGIFKIGVIAAVAGGQPVRPPRAS